MHPLAASESPFDLAFGLPLHPLAVHVPVVLLPLGAIGVLLVLLVPRWRTRLAWPVVAVLGIAAAGALVAQLSGQALAARVGTPDRHAQLGGWVLAMAAILAASTLAWWLWQRRLARRRRDNGIIGLILGTVLAALALGAVIVAVLAGYTGAAAVWEGTIDSPGPSAPASETSSPTATGSPGAQDGEIGIAEVAQHGDSASCWIAVEGTVYDVTAWVPDYPGGPAGLLAICGTEATEAFAEQQGDSAESTELLSQFAIGALAED